jgi:hypothetical protein
MHTFPIFRRFPSARSSSVTFFAVVLLFGVTAPLDLVAQQAEVDNAAPNIFAASSAAAPTVDEQPQASSASAQSTPDGSAPAQTSPTSQGATSQSATESQSQQTKRILGVIPNFRAVSADVKLPPQSVKEKFVTATEDSFDYSSVFIPALLAGYDLAVNATPEFHEGAAGYGRYFWHSAVDQTSENYMVEFVVPSLAHEDTRYYTLGRGGFFKRTGYALSRAVITRSDSGKETFNLSEVVGAGASSGLSNLYYPSAERSLSSTGEEWGLDIAIDAASFCVKEFWPDVNRHLFHNKNAANSVQQ